jgi:hypothetical protein
MAADVWGDADCISNTQHAYGKGRVYCGRPVADVLQALRVSKDFEASRPLDGKLAWIHRAMPDADIYFVANQTDQRQAIEARFRVHGKAPEFWHPDTGAIEPADYSEDGSVVPMELAERESVFLVFRQTVASPARRTTHPLRTASTVVDGAWDVKFPPNLGAPAEIRMPALVSWTANSDAGVKYFSGTAEYRQTVMAPRTWIQPGTRVLLDLGVVKDLAEVSVNGKLLGIAWKPPYEFDVTDVLKAGANELQLKVTNEWSNRILGDRVGPPEKRVFPTPATPVGGGAGTQQPAESGLIGPVRILVRQ